MAVLTQARARELFNYNPDTGALTWRRRCESEFATVRAARCWNSRFTGQDAGHKDHRGYSRVNIDGRMYLKHRLVWLHAHGEWPNIMDHIDGDPSNDRLHNLRDVTIAENQRNLRLQKESRHQAFGISFEEKSQRWKAMIQHGGKAVFIGSYDTKHDAVIARKAAEKVLGFHINHGKQRKAEITPLHGEQG